MGVPVRRGKEEPPSEPKKPFFVRWLGHFFSFFSFGKPKPKQVQKTDEFFQKMQAEKNAAEAGSRVVLDRYYHNLDVILKLSSEDLKYLKVKEGKLTKSEETTTKEEQEEALDLLHQTYRQAWGRMIDAQHGYVAKEVELQSLNKLQDHLNRHFPEAKPPISPEQPLRILTEGYKAKMKVPKKIQKEREKIRKQTEEKVREQRLALVVEELGRELKGLNPAVFLKVSESEDLSPVAVRKYLGDKNFASFLFQETMGPIDTYAKLASVNELIASYLNTLFDKRFGFSYTLRVKSTTAQAYVENIGSYHDVENEKELFTKMPQLESQRFVLGQLALGNRDCHTKNILMRDDYAPIGIDFGHILGLDPLSDIHQMRLCFLDWPSIDQPLSNEDYDFLSQIKIEEVIAEIRRNLESENPDFYKDKTFKSLIETETNILAARLCLLQEAAKERLTLRQILALFLPPISDDENKSIEKEYNEKMKRRQRIEKKEVTASLLNKHMLEYGFKKAWKRSKGNLKKFRNEIVQEIKKVKKVDSKKLRGENEKNWYRRAGIDI